MSKSKLPTHPSDAWRCAFRAPPQLVRRIACQRGRVVAGAEQIFLLKPGAEHFMCRERPDKTGPIIAIAAEGRGPGRVAVATEGGQVSVIPSQGVGIFRGRNSLGSDASHLAWGPPSPAGPSPLYIRWDHGELTCLSAELEMHAYEDMGQVDAIASDDNGVLVAVSFEGPEAGAKVTRDGREWVFRKIHIEADAAPAQVHLAIAENAIAMTIGDGHVYLSRAPDQDLERCGALPNATGPIAFQGASSDAALLAFVHDRGTVATVRLDESGTLTRISELETDAPSEIARGFFTDAAWDASRNTLWAASPMGGLCEYVAPGARKGRLS